MRDVVGTGAIFENADITRLLLTDTNLAGADWTATDPATSITNAGGDAVGPGDLAQGQRSEHNS